MKLVLFALIAQQFAPPIGYEKLSDLEYIGAPPKTFRIEAWQKVEDRDEPCLEKIYILSGSARRELPLPSSCSTGSQFSFTRFTVGAKEKVLILDRKVATGQNEAFLYRLGANGFMPATSRDQSLNEFIVKKIGLPGKPMAKSEPLIFVLPVSWTKAGSVVLDVAPEDPRGPKGKWYRVTLDPKSGRVSPYKRVHP